MPLPDEVRLRHLVESAETAVRFVEGRQRSDLDDDEMLRLVHHYFDIDLDVLWSTVTDDLPALLAALDR